MTSSGAALAWYTATYDAAGSRTGVVEVDGKRVTYQYDALGQLTGEDAGAALPLAAAYTFDGMGNRLTRTVVGVTSIPARQPQTQGLDTGLTSVDLGPGIFTSWAGHRKARGGPLPLRVWFAPHDQPALCLRHTERAERRWAEATRRNSRVPARSRRR